MTYALKYRILYIRQCRLCLADPFCLQIFKVKFIVSSYLYERVFNSISLNSSGSLCNLASLGFPGVFPGCDVGVIFVVPEALLPQESGTLRGNGPPHDSFLSRASLANSSPEFEEVSHPACFFKFGVELIQGSRHHDILPEVPHGSPGFLQWLL